MLITFTETQNHIIYRMVTEPVEDELKRRGYQTKVVDPSKNETPHEDSKLVVSSAFLSLVSSLYVNVIRLSLICSHSV